LCPSHNCEDFLLLNENLPTVGLPQDYSILCNRMKVCLDLRVLIIVIGTIDLMAQHALLKLGIIGQPRNFIFTISSIYFYLQPICKGECNKFFVMNFNKLFNHTEFDTE